MWNEIIFVKLCVSRKWRDFSENGEIVACVIDWNFLLSNII